MTAAPSLAPGQTIAGRYVIVSHLGSGGMGDVYEVEHTLLGKRFALKRLSEHATGDRAMVQRFLREARAAAATGHPGVVDVVDVGFSEDDLPYLVMEKLTGETLRRRLDRGAMDTPTILRMGHAILDALGAVHATGIIHRDLKPENLFLCSDGRLKILDFGLSHDTAVDVRLTQSGAVMGTPMYMSPEQARGVDVDARTDLYAVATVLYEAAAGRPPFVAPAYSVLVAMILEDLPAPEPIAHLPSPVRETILAALAKSPDARPADAEAMRAGLGVEPEGEGWGLAAGPVRGGDDVASQPTVASGAASPAATRRERPKPVSGSAPATAAGSGAATAAVTATAAATATVTGTATAPATRPRWILPVAGAIVIGGGVAGYLALRGGGSGGAPTIAVTASRRLTLAVGCEEYPRFAGNELIYDGLADGDDEILAIGLDGTNPRRLTHAAGWDYAPAVSPDGARVAYVHEAPEGRVLRVMPSAGGDPHDLGTISGYPAWTRDGALLVGDASGRIVRWELGDDLAAGITRETVLGQLPAGARPYHLAAIEGGGVAILWWTSSEADRSALGELDPDGKLRVIEESATDYEGGLAASRTRRGYYATRKGATTGNELLWRPWGGGAPIAVPGDLGPRAGLDVSPDGAHLAFSTCSEHSYVARVRTGAAPVVVSRGEWQDGAPLGVDAQHLLITSDRRGRQQGWLVDLATGDGRAVTPPDSHGATPSPGGKLIAYAADGGRGGIAIASVDGGDPRSLTSDPSDSAPTFSHDGANVLFVRAAAGGKPHVHVVPASGGADRMLAAGFEPAASPVDGAIAYVTAADDTGASQVLVTDLAGAAPRPVAGLPPGEWQHPRFSADGKRLLLVRGYKELVSVPLDGSAPPTTLWTAGTESILAADWAPDGDGVVAALGEYDGDIWLADGQFP